MLNVDIAGLVGQGRPRKMVTGSGEGCVENGVAI
jgi:hypothetical protein